MNKDEIKFDYEEIQIGNKIFYGLDNELVEFIKNQVETIENAITYIKYIVIFNQNINGRLSETLWGQELLDILEKR